ncbi:MAG: hypothetical protein OHK0029_03510 [Armatimonadaceae bacterium]
MEELQGTGARRKASPPPRNGSGAKLVAILLLIGLLSLAGGWFLRVGKSIGGEGGGIPSVIGSLTNPRGEFPNQNRITVLLIGKDFSRYISKTNRELNGMPYSKEARSDSIMLATLDFDKRTVTLLSIPRDTYVYDIDGEAGKINATYRLGGEKRLAQTIEKLIGVKPDYYVSVRIPGVKEIVDAVGGVEVETIDAMEYHDFWGGLHVDLPKGRQVIDGEQAIGFARFREADIYERNPDGSPIPVLNSSGKPRLDSSGNPIFKRRRHIEHSEEEGDPRRMARQQQLIRAIIQKAKSFDNLFKIDQVVNTGLEQVETNMDRMQLFALAAMFRSIQPEQIQSGTLPGEGGMRGSYWYFQLDKEKSAKMVEWLVRGDERAGNALTVVEVQNATEVRGAAKEMVERLREGGFDARNGGNADRDPETGELTTTRILYRKAAAVPRAEQIAQILGGGTLIKQTDPDADENSPDIVVMLGRDTVAPPQTGDAPQDPNDR